MSAAAASEPQASKSPERSRFEILRLACTIGLCSYNSVFVNKP
jgi:hypothetical protein